VPMAMIADCTRSMPPLLQRRCSCSRCGAACAARLKPVAARVAGAAHAVHVPLQPPPPPPPPPGPSARGKASSPQTAPRASAASGGRQWASAASAPPRCCCCSAAAAAAAAAAPAADEGREGEALVRLVHLRDGPATRSGAGARVSTRRFTKHRPARCSQAAAGNPGALRSAAGALRCAQPVRPLLARRVALHNDGNCMIVSACRPHAPGGTAKCKCTRGQGACVSQQFDFSAPERARRHREATRPQRRRRLFFLSVQSLTVPARIPARNRAVAPFNGRVPADSCDGRS
jgi:hypothetical protein